MIRQKRLSKFLAPVLATVAGAALSILTTASAAAPISAASGDLFLGFRTTGSTDSYLLKLGTVTQFTGYTPGQVVPLSLGSVGADLVATFGPSWFSSADVTWGIFGFSNTTNPNLYSSVARTSPGVLSTPFSGPAASTLADRQATANQVVNVENWINGKTSTTNSNFGIVQTGVSGSASYNVQVGTPSTTDFGSTSTWGSIEGSFAAGTSGAVLDLWRYPNLTINGGVISTLGKFTLDNSGAITFTAVAPVPEPSSVALIALTAAGLAGLYRRRPSAPVVA